MAEQFIIGDLLHGTDRPGLAGTNLRRGLARMSRLNAICWGAMRRKGGDKVGYRNSIDDLHAPTHGL